MRTTRAVSLLLAILAGAALFASLAGAVAMPSPVTTKAPAAATPAVPPAAVVVKTAANLPGASYPWVEPVWVKAGAVTLARPPARSLARMTQPPAWIAIG